MQVLLGQALMFAGSTQVPPAPVQVWQAPQLTVQHRPSVH
jgi:hypothetical protein